MEQFYIILRDKKESYVTKRHTDRAEAMQEAERLSKKEGARFYVLKAFLYVEPARPPLEWTAMIRRKEGNET